MVHRIVFHRRAEAELDELYELLLTRAGPVIAGAYVQGVYDFIDDLATFPERGTIREGIGDCGLSGIAAELRLPS